MYGKFIWVYLTLVTCELSIKDIFIPDYDVEGQQIDLSSKFRLNRRKNRLKDERVRILDQYLQNKTIYLDGVAHYIDGASNADKKLINNIETEFRNIIGMNGVKYIFKRDAFWRTWREVKEAFGNKIVCYKCQNAVKMNCSNCHSGGYWMVDETPPCPYELLSLKNDNDICVNDYTQAINTKNTCNNLITFTDLFVNCNNPIETKFIIRRDYKSVSERYPNIICNWRQNCHFSTEYVINKEETIFRIVNSSNIVIYSKIMKSGSQNYVCIHDCGYRNPDTNKVTNEKSLLLDLFDVKNNKIKREYGKIYKKPFSQKFDEFLRNKTDMNPLSYERIDNQRFQIEKAGNLKKDYNLEITTMSHCKRLEKHRIDLQNDIENSDY